jgi:succinoglycan biosynthesis transport protein ExoP
VLSNLRQAISVQRRGLTYLILIEARSADPETAANIANTLANAYISEQIEAKVRSVLASRDTIQPRVADASATLVAAEQAFDKFLASNIEEIAAATGRTDLVELRALLEDSSLQNARIQAKAELVDRSLSRKDWQAVTESLQSATLQSLDAQRQALANDLAAATEGSQRFDLRAKLAEVETSMDQAANAELTSLRQQLIASQAKTSDLRVQLRTSVLQSDLPAEITTEIYGLQQNAELSRVQYQSLLGRLQELDVQAYLQVPDSRVVSEALPPFRPSFPNPQLMLTLAGMAGLALGIGLAFLYENFVGGFTSVEQVQSVLRVPVATSVPLQRGGRRSRSGSDVGGVAQLVVDAPLSIFAESIRHIRVGLDRALRRRRKQPRIGYVVMVSSAAPHEGKTTVALSLARTYALSGRSTVLIDCDLRKPTVHRHLGIEPARGLLEVLHDKSGITSLDSILQVDLATGVRIAPGARRSELATDHLIAGKEFAELLRTVTESYDIVVLDTPPVGPVVDGLYLAQFADAIAFVVKWSSTSQQDAKSALTALRDAKRPGVTILGVLNQLQITKSAERSKYAGYYEDV